MAKRAIRWALLGLLLPLLAGCSSVVARVNGKNITKAEYYEELQRAAGLQVLHGVIMRQLLMERAAAEKCLPSAEEVKQRLALLKKKQFGDDDAKMRKAMKESAIDDMALQDRIKYDLARFKLRTRKLKPTEEELKRFFSEYRAKFFDLPERVTYRQIIVRDKREAQKIIAELNNDSAIFNELARNASLDPNPAARENGGLYEDQDLKLMQENAPPLYAALKKLEPNQITQTPVAVQTQQKVPMFLVLKLIETKPKEAADYEKIKDDVRQAYLEANAESDQELDAEIARGANVIVLAERFKAALEPAFQAAKGGPGTPGMPNVSPEMQKQLEKKPEIAPPTQLDEKSIPKPVTPGSGGGN